MRLISGLCRKIIIVQSHFSTVNDINNFNLSPMAENEGLPGRWYKEGGSEDDNAKWSSWENAQSFWIQREYLIGAIYENGFDMVFEQYDCLPPPIAESIALGYYKTDNRCMFVGIRTGV